VFLNFRGTNLLHSVFSLLLKSTHSVLLPMTIVYSRIQEGHHHHHNPHLDLELYLNGAFATTTSSFFLGGGALSDFMLFFFFFCVALVCACFWTRARMMMMLMMLFDMVP
jgi:hypothetical protein